MAIPDAELEVRKAQGDRYFLADIVPSMFGFTQTYPMDLITNPTGMLPNNPIGTASPSEMYP